MSEHEHGESSKKSANRERAALTAIVVGGVALVAVLLSPFLLEMFGSHKSDDAPQFSEDAAGLTAEEMAGDKPIGSKTRKKFQSWHPIYDNFGGLKLGSTRQEVEKKYPLYLKGKADAIPAVYESTNQTSALKFRGDFYDNQLKEFTIVFGPFRDSPDALKEQLYKGLGEGPRYRFGDNNSGTRIGLSDPDLVKLLSSFQRAEPLMWGDGSNRVDATIYSAATESNKFVTALAVRVSATAWLDDYQKQAQAGMTVRLKEPEKPSESSGNPGDRGGSK